MNSSFSFFRDSLVVVAILMMGISHAHSMSANKVSSDDYAGNHNAKNIRMAVGSKAFSWLSGSPADNEKLAIGKSAQFFGFVALRYESGRKAHRGNLGKAFYQLATPAQQNVVREKAQLSVPKLEQWWQVRQQILAQLEQHLYTGETFNRANLMDLGQQFGLTNAQAALYESQACVEIEKTLTEQQKKQLAQWRENPQLVANKKGKQKGDKVKLKHLPKEFANQHEAIFAKCFAYLTGTFEDRQVVPLGQPAQFFGFVSLRQKSGRGAKRGQVSRDFYQLLNAQQTDMLETLTERLIPLTASFMLLRDELLKEMDFQRVGSTQAFDENNYNRLAKEMGKLEIQIAMLEASAYRQVRINLSNEQQAQLMQMRSMYDINKKTTVQLQGTQRGKQLYMLCAGCHEAGNQIAPHLDNIVNRPVASTSFDYSSALKAEQGKKWDINYLDRFLASPKKAVPGTTMEFTGLLNEKDRNALIQYMQKNN